MQSFGSIAAPVGITHDFTYMTKRLPSILEGLTMAFSRRDAADGDDVGLR